MKRQKTKKLHQGEGWYFNEAPSRVMDTSETGRKQIKLRMEKRKGKPVTVLYEMEGVNDPRNLARTLKNLVSAGGTVKDGTIEIQGEHRERLRVYLSDEGFNVKG